MDVKPLEDLLLYAKVSRSHRAGGYNFRGTNELSLVTFEPELVTAYEIGARAAWFDERLQWSLAWYRSDFEDMQLRLQVVAQTGPIISNGGESRIEGGELEISALLGATRISGTLGITDGQYTKLAPGVLGVSPGSRFLNTPDTTASLAIDVPISLGVAEINLHADYGWRDDVAFAYDPSSPAQQGAYGLFNAMLTAMLSQENFELRLWGRNLTDERYLARIVDRDPSSPPSPASRGRTACR